MRGLVDWIISKAEAVIARWPRCGRGFGDGHFGAHHCKRRRGHWGNCYCCTGQ